MSEPTLEERITALEEAVALLTAEQDYQLGYSGEQVDSLLGAVSTATDGNSGGDVKSVVNKYKTTAAAYTQARIKALTDYSNSLYNALPNGNVIGAVNRAYPLILRWDSKPIDPQTISAGGSVTIWFTLSDVIPASYTNDCAVIATSETEDYEDITVTTKYYVSGRDVKVRVTEHNDTAYSKSNVKVTSHVLIIAKSTGGGAIGPLY